MTAEGTFLDAVVQALTEAGAYNQQDVAPAVVVLWTDKERQWEALLPNLRERLPVFTLERYDPEQARGPAYWLRCIVARTIPHPSLTLDRIPILYLPGYSRQDVRAREDCPRPLQPLAELQYRGVLWTQKNARDWTISAFLQSRDGGLAIEVGPDAGTREALRRALLKLAAEPIEELRRAAPIRAPFLDGLNHPDDVKTVLRWLNDPNAFRQQASPEGWESFVTLCQARFGFHPALDGPITAARLLGEQRGKWGNVWRRFGEAPAIYSALPEKLRQARETLLVPRVDSMEAWPQENDAAESSLRQALLDLAGTYPQAARDAIVQLEREHRPRREWVWAALGRARLAQALEHLATLATETARPLGGSSVKEIVLAYAGSGWRADLAVLDALGAVETSEDAAAVCAAIRSVYRPWLEDGAMAFQKAVATADAANGYVATTPVAPSAGTCVLLVDGLRFDVAQRLKARLESRGLECRASAGLGPLPGITATAKPAVSPAAAAFTGNGGDGFEPVVVTSRAKSSADVLRRELKEINIQILRADELGDPVGQAWTETGSIDATGHDHGWRLAQYLPGELRLLERRVMMLLEHGWQRVIVVTDHGWLLLPGGLPKVDLPEHLAETRKGRCARLKQGAATGRQTVPWHWDPDVRIAVPSGICCFEAGKDYDHGGLSPQECVVPILTVTAARKTEPLVTVESVTWRRLRCSITIRGVRPGLTVDLRTKVGDPTTTLVTRSKELPADGTATLLIEDEVREGEGAVVVVLGSDGGVLAQVATVVGS